jgi:hypothetical protein
MVSASADRRGQDVSTRHAPLAAGRGAPDGGWRGAPRRACGRRLDDPEPRTRSSIESPLAPGGWSLMQSKTEWVFPSPRRDGPLFKNSWYKARNRVRKRKKASRPIMRLSRSSAHLLVPPADRQRVLRFADPVRRRLENINSDFKASTAPLMATGCLNVGDDSTRSAPESATPVATTLPFTDSNRMHSHNRSSNTDKP